MGSQDVAVKLMADKQRRSWLAERAAVRLRRRHVREKPPCPHYACSPPQYERLHEADGPGKFHIVSPMSFDVLPDNTRLMVLEAGVSDFCDAAAWAGSGHSGKFALGECTFAREAALQTAFALSHCHANGVAHRDVKPDNLLLFRLSTETTASLPTGPPSLPSAASGHSVTAHTVASSQGRRGAASASSGSEPTLRDQARQELKDALKSLWSEPEHQGTMESFTSGGGVSGTFAPGEGTPHSTGSSSDGGVRTQPSNTAALTVCHSFATKLCDFGAVAMTRSPSEGISNKPFLEGASARGTAKYACPQVMVQCALGDPKGTGKQLWPNSRVRKALMAARYNSYSADVWSFAITVCVLVTGKVPFRQASASCSGFRAFVRATQPQVLQDAIMAPAAPVWAKDEDKARSRVQSPEGGGDTGGHDAFRWPCAISNALEDLLLRCLRVRESERPTILQIASHPWFSNPMWVPAEPVLQPAPTPMEPQSPQVGVAAAPDTASVRSGTSSATRRLTIVTDFDLPSIRSGGASTVRTHLPLGDTASDRLSESGSRPREITREITGGSAYTEDHMGVRSPGQYRTRRRSAVNVSDISQASASGHLPPLQPGSGSVTVQMTAGIHSTPLQQTHASPSSATSSPVRQPVFEFRQAGE
ncbi:unnamed protein product [Symbiodinium sp. KB8]|nr:unnamed protein product [Symbiodinium sp. KB8]